MEEILKKFNKAYILDVRDKVEKKNGFNYLSWAFAWKSFKEVYPDATYNIRTNSDGLNHFGNEEIGYMVYTDVTAMGLTYEMWLPIMDLRNKAVLKPNMMDINKAIMRCLTKNLAMHGTGLYLYVGEDLPLSFEDIKAMSIEELREIVADNETAMAFLKSKDKKIEELDREYLITSVARMYGIK